METIFQSLVTYISFAIMTTISQILILFGPGLLLALLMYYIARALERLIHSVLGWRAYVYGFQILGTPVHETGHALFARLFGHKIIDFKPFKPDPATGTLGYVRHAYNEKNIYHNIGNFFIGIGPIILGSLVIYASSILLLGAETFAPLKDIAFENQDLASLQSVVSLAGEIYPNILSVLLSVFTAENFTTWQFYLFLYIMLSVGTAVTLSTSDIKGALSGFFTLVAVLFAFNLITLWVAGDFTRIYLEQVTRYMSVFYAMMLFTMVMDLVLAVLFYILLRLKTALFR